ncbi:Uncharacterized protein OBRU01_07957 [Operophtera brumata]|uniref:Uncharacterized protein n=1 Tax=Operophtera brumata TaxID=104452 RepID=A0A0L7LI20_OPEBR|nr:Uncharacterized protein OBRU01_07957 [Operophtera brumata]
MRKRKSVKKGDESEGSEHGGEPEEFQDSGEDWTPDADSNEPAARPAAGRKRATKPALNNSKKKKKAEESSEESEPEGEEDEDDEEGEGDLDEEDGSDDEKNGSDGNKSDSSQSKDVPKHFHYSGWNVDNRENYYPITEILDRNPRTESKEICVALDLNDLLKIRDK